MQLVILDVSSEQYASIIEKCGDTTKLDNYNIICAVASIVLAFFIAIMSSIKEHLSHNASSNHPTSSRLVKYLIKNIYPISIALSTITGLVAIISLVWNISSSSVKDCISKEVADRTLKMLSEGNQLQKNLNGSILPPIIIVTNSQENNGQFDIIIENTDSIASYNVSVKCADYKQNTRNIVDTQHNKGNLEPYLKGTCFIENKYFNMLAKKEVISFIGAHNSELLHPSINFQDSFGLIECRIYIGNGSKYIEQLIWIKNVNGLIRCRWRMFKKMEDAYVKILTSDDALVNNSDKLPDELWDKMFSFSETKWEYIPSSTNIPAVKKTFSRNGWEKRSSPIPTAKDILHK